MRVAARKDGRQTVGWWPRRYLKRDQRALILDTDYP